MIFFYFLNAKIQPTPLPIVSGHYIIFSICLDKIYNLYKKVLNLVFFATKLPFAPKFKTKFLIGPTASQLPLDLCGGSVMQLKQEKFWLAGNSSTEDKFTWWVPITYHLLVSDQAGFYWLNDTFGSIPLLDQPVDEPFVLNLNQEGYFRVNYPEKNWNALTSMLLTNTTSLSSLTRAQLLDDSLNLARAGRLPYSVSLDLTRYLEHELDLVPWNSVLNYGLAYLDVRLQSSGSDYALLQNYLKTLLEEVYGTAESEDLVGEKLRYLVTSWSCYLENSDCLDTARNLWDSWKQSSVWEYEVAPEDKGWAYCNGIRQVVQSAVCTE